jgi:hypothetical protein
MTREEVVQDDAMGLARLWSRLADMYAYVTCKVSENPNADANHMPKVGVARVEMGMIQIYSAHVMQDP